MIYNKLSTFGAIIGFLFCLQSCIDNDLPYPTIKGEILEIDMEGMVSAKIDDNANTVTVKIADTLSLENIRIKKLVVTEGATLIPDSSSCVDFIHFPDTGFVSVDSLPKTMNTRMNFKKPVSILLKLYQDYPWTITVQREINRVIKVKNQVGAPLIDEQNKQVIIYVDKEAQPKFNNIEVEELKLGSSIAVTKPSADTIHDFRRPQVFYVTAFNETEKWTINVVHPSDDMQQTELSAWAKRAYLKGTTKTGNIAIQYRIKGNDAWESMLSNELTVAGEDFLAMLTHLRPCTDYEYLLTLDGKTQDIATFRTDTAQQLPNLSFDKWYQSGKIAYPNQDLSKEFFFWDSGNQGTSIAGGKNPTSEEKRDVIKGSALRMASEYVVVKFAAGNLYSGSFVELIGMKGAMLDFGRPYTARPSALEGYYKYTSGVIDNVGDKFKEMYGQKDSCHIYIGLFSDWKSPFRVNSETEKFVDITWKNESLLAFGELKTNQSSSEYKSFKIPLTYRNNFTKPTYVVMVASASKYGDYFTGSAKSVLLLDECELIFE